jgi:hypothetical protein
MGLYSKGYNDGIASDCFSLTPSDAAGLLAAEGDRLPAIRALYIETGGNLHYETEKGVERTIPVPNKFVVECAIVRVYAAGTTATGMLGFE